MVLMITGLVIYRGEESIYFPYAYNMVSLSQVGKNVENILWLPKVSLYSIGYFLLFSVAGYINIYRKNIT